MEIIKQELADRKAFLEELAEQLESSLACAPPGKLRINRRDGKPQYYLKLKKGERDGKYIRKSEIAKAAAIAQRDYEKDALKTTLAEIAGIDTLLGIWENRTVEGTFDKLALPRKVLVIPATVSDEEYARKWQEVQYKRKGFSPEDPELFSTSGDRVRSKSEGLLKDNFDYFKVPCRIECPLKLLTGEIIHPDFTLLNVKTRKGNIWGKRMIPYT